MYEHPNIFHFISLTALLCTEGFLIALVYAEYLTRGSKLGFQTICDFTNDVHKLPLKIKSSVSTEKINTPSK